MGYQVFIGLDMVNLFLVLILDCVANLNLYKTNLKLYHHYRYTCYV